MAENEEEIVSVVTSVSPPPAGGLDVLGVVVDELYNRYWVDAKDTREVYCTEDTSFYFPTEGSFDVQGGSSGCKLPFVDNKLSAVWMY